MNVLKSIFLCGCLTFAFNTASAQYGGYGNNGMGRQQGMGMGGAPSDPNRYAKSPETIEKERAENTNKTIETLKTELNLDELQLIVIRKEIESGNKKIYALFKNEETSQEDKAKEIDAITEKMDTTINTFLNNEQKAKYKKVIEARKERMDKIKEKRLR